MSLDIRDYDYYLPEGRVAFYPSEPRDASRLLYLPRSQGETKHLRFTDFPGFLRPGDLLVLNDSKVFPARLIGSKKGTGGKVEIFLLQEITDGTWEALVRPGRRLPPGTQVDLFDGTASARLGERTDSGGRIVSFEADRDLLSLIWQYGKVPLPPYIDREAEEEDKSRYQTIYARNVGAVAAPTAGFHFTETIMTRVKDAGVEMVKLTLHSGLGTFRPITRSDFSQHKMHEEKFFIPKEAADAVNLAKQENRRVIAVGTTSVRALESACTENGQVMASNWKETSLFISPPYDFRCVDGLLTNFHLPKSTLLLLVSAFAGRERVLAAYEEAIKLGYRFYSYGDAMLIL
ncbi:MAG: tRNA preQ1(34) S-adenosylmethionine ribosyltransferase-isomerase QueA [candidate division Zixibacteria bacterium RBG_16_53_22]|nr:MAG: tRNA preQ1(34) S-adenosylmethionine ribosyltransferase-isomerase QueA [candidate division Zixibacteria bacterium RBG_16_53_22]